MSDSATTNVTGAPGTIAGYKVHPAAALVPSMSAEEFADLKSSIEINGLIDPGTTHGGEILDGRHRARACDELGIDFETIEDDLIDCGGDPYAFVLARITRRNLSKAQLACVAAEALPRLRAEAKERQGTRTDIRPKVDGSSSGRADENAAEMFGVGSTYVKDAAKVLAVSPELFSKLKAGEESMASAKVEVMAIEWFTKHEADLPKLAEASGEWRQCLKAADNGRARSGKSKERYLWDHWRWHERSGRKADRPSAILGGKIRAKKKSAPIVSAALVSEVPAEASIANAAEKTSRCDSVPGPTRGSEEGLPFVAFNEDFDELVASINELTERLSKPKDEIDFTGLGEFGFRLCRLTEQVEQLAACVAFQRGRPA